jgi:hypothetical protein
MDAAGVALLQWQNTKLHARVARGCPAAVAGSQIASLSKGRIAYKLQLLVPLHCALPFAAPNVFTASLHRCGPSLLRPLA